MAKVYLKPEKGLIVRDPADSGKPLPEDGKLVDFDTYWRRRLIEKSVVRMKPPAQPKKPSNGSKE